MKFIEKRKQMRSQGGFTLIELLVVIAVLAVLAGVVVFAVGGVTGTASARACRVEARTIKTAIEAYKADAKPGDPAPTIAGLTTYLDDAAKANTNFTLLTLTPKTSLEVKAGGAYADLAAADKTACVA